MPLTQTKEGKIQELGILTLPSLLNIHHECSRLAETGEVSLSCYSRHDILCAAQDIFLMNISRLPFIMRFSSD